MTDILQLLDIKYIEMEKFRQNIEKLYKENLKNPAFFEKVGIKKENFRKLFAENANPGTKSVERVTDVAGVSMAWLFGEIEERTIAEHIIRNGGSQPSGEVEALKRLVESLEARIRDKESIIGNDTATIQALQETIKAQAQLIAEQAGRPQSDLLHGQASNPQKNIGGARK